MSHRRDVQPEAAPQQVLHPPRNGRGAVGAETACRIGFSRPQNYDRAQTLASIQRIQQSQKNLNAPLVIQGDPRDTGKLPASQAAAK